jgi:hypothetical protein
MQSTPGNNMQAAAMANTEATASEKFAGICAWIVGIGGIIYSLAFLILGNSTIYSLGLLIGGLLSTLVLTALYARVKAVDSTIATWGLLLGIVGAAGAFIHGGFDLANSINVPTNLPAAAPIDVPSQIDPRGMLTFGVAGLALFVFAWLIGKSRSFPQAFGYLTWLLAVLLVVIYLVRLIIYDPNASPIIKPALGLTGFIVNPLWYIWLGLILQRGGERQ